MDEQVQILRLLLRLLTMQPKLSGTFSNEFSGPPSDWRDWRHTYALLLSQKRIWDFRDLLLDFFNHQREFGFGDCDFTLTTFFSSDSPDEFCRRIHDDWMLAIPGVSAHVALVDIFSAITLNYTSTDEVKPLAHAFLRFANYNSDITLSKDQTLAGSLPLLRWLFAKTCVATCTRSKQNAMLDNIAGHDRGRRVVPRIVGQGTPFYIPIGTENPGWMEVDMGANPRNVLRTLLGVAKTQENYWLQAACLSELASKSSSPRPFLDELSDLQRNKQGDLYGCLVTCMSKYLVYKDERSRQTLKAELAGLGTWMYPQGLATPLLFFVAIRDIVLCALSPTEVEAHGSSIQAGLRYYSFLPPWLQLRMEEDVEYRSRGAFTVRDGAVVARRRLDMETRQSIVRNHHTRGSASTSPSLSLPPSPPPPLRPHASPGVSAENEVDEHHRGRPPIEAPHKRDESGLGGANAEHAVVKQFRSIVPASRNNRGLKTITMREQNPSMDRDEDGRRRSSMRSDEGRMVLYKKQEEGEQKADDQVSPLYGCPSVRTRESLEPPMKKSQEIQNDQKMADLPSEVYRQNDGRRRSNKQSWFNYEPENLVTEAAGSTIRDSDHIKGKLRFTLFIKGPRTLRCGF